MIFEKDILCCTLNQLRNMKNGVDKTICITSINSQSEDVNRYGVCWKPEVKKTRLESHAETTMITEDSGWRCLWISPMSSHDPVKGLPEYVSPRILPIRMSIQYLACKKQWSPRGYCDQFLIDSGYKEFIWKSVLFSFQWHMLSATSIL
jgi:hypothetical protein